MLPDSTVMDPKRPKKKRKSSDNFAESVPTKKTKKKSEPSRKKPVKKKLKKKADDEDYGSDMDLGKELQPISDYLKDRRELVSQMFASLKKAKLQSMLPEILKKYSLKEIELFCCDQIEIMSKKRIAALIKGEKVEEISSSGTDDESTSGNDDIVTIERVELDPPDSTGVTVELPNIYEEIEKVKPHSIAVAMGTHSKPVNKQKLEILELEMRARAIKKMLQSQQEGDSDDDDISDVPFSQVEIDIEILQHMASEQTCTSPQPQLHDVVVRDESSGNNAIRQQPVPVHPKRKIDPSEMEPGELCDDDEEIIMESAGESSNAVVTVDIRDDCGEVDIRPDITEQASSDIHPDTADTEQANPDEYGCAIPDSMLSNATTMETSLAPSTRVDSDIVAVENLCTENIESDNKSLKEQRANSATSESSTSNTDTPRIERTDDSDVVAPEIGDQVPAVDVVQTSPSTQQSCAADESQSGHTKVVSDDETSEPELSMSDKMDKSLSSTKEASLECTVRPDITTYSTVPPEGIPSEEVAHSPEQSAAVNPTSTAAITSAADTAPDATSAVIDSSPAAPSTTCAVITSVSTASVITAPGVLPGRECEDIFEEDVDGGRQDDGKAVTTTTLKQSVAVSLADGDDTNSALYEDVPSPGHHVPEQQVHAISQSTDNQPGDNESPLCSLTLGNQPAKSSVSPTLSLADSQSQNPGLNWSAGLDVNLDELQNELLASDKEGSDSDSSEDMPSISGKSDTHFGSSADPLDVADFDRAPTPEITAQRYRSRLVSTMPEEYNPITSDRHMDYDLVKKKLSDIDVSSKDKSPKRVERKTKVYTSATTVGESKSHKSASKGRSKLARNKTNKKATSKRGGSSPERSKRRVSPKTAKRDTSAKAQQSSVSPKSSKRSTSLKSTKRSTSPKSSKRSTSPKSRKCNTSLKSRKRSTTPNSSKRNTSPKTRKRSVSPSKAQRKRGTSPKTIKHSGSAKPSKRSASPETQKRSMSPKTSKRSTSSTTRKRSTSPKTGKRYTPHKDDEMTNTQKSSSRSDDKYTSKKSLDKPSGTNRNLSRDSSPTLSARFHAYDSERVPELPEFSCSKSRYGGRSRSPHSPPRYRGSREDRDSYSAQVSHRSHERARPGISRDTHSVYGSHDDRSRTYHRDSRPHLDEKHVSPKRFRAEWEATSKVITLDNKPALVKTYDREPHSKLKKVTSTKNRPLTPDVDDGPKSPVRFPSPDIKVINKVKSEPKPLLLVISDSD